MFILRLIRTVAGLYSLLLILHFALPYFTAAQQPWMAVLTRLCEPGVKLGNWAAVKLMPRRRFRAEVGAITAAVLCWAVWLLLGLFM